MGTRPDTPVRALRRRHDALLTIWLAFLDELDNPVHPRAAECQQEQRLRRDTSTRGLSQIKALNCSLLVHSAKRPRLLDSVPARVTEARRSDRLMLRKRNTDSAITADPANNKVAAAHIEAVPMPALKEPPHSFSPSNCRTSAERAGAGHSQ